MFIDFLLLGFAFLISIPLLCGYYAYTHGRSFWLWFLIGTALPIVSYFILLLLPDKTNPVDAQIDALKIGNSLMGTKRDLPTNPLLRKILLTQKDQVGFIATISPRGDYQTLEMTLNGRPLIELLRSVEGYPNQVHYEGLPVHNVLYPSAHFLGQPLRLYWGDADGRTALLIHQHQEVLTKAIMARVAIYPSHIFLYDFVCREGTSLYRFEKIGGFVFNRLQYVDALDRITKPVSERRG